MGRIITKLMGGLGNQLFQLTAGLYVAEKVGRRLILDVSYYDQNQCHDGFCLPEIMDLGPLGIEVIRRPSRLVSPIVVRESEDGPDHAMRMCSRLPDWMGLQLRGYWQVAKFAEVMRHRLVSNFSGIESDYRNTFFLHFRRGDYLSAGNKELYDIIPKRYYSDAINYVLNNHSNPRILVVSDDIEYAGLVIQTLPEADYQVLQVTDTFSTFRIMTSCVGAVCANSSFSWWAAFLQRNNRCWILPEKWDNIHPELAFQRWPRLSRVLPEGLVICEGSPDE